MKGQEKMIWSINNSGEVPSKLKSRGLCATSLSTNDFSILYTTLPHKLIDKKNFLIGLSMPSKRSSKTKVRSACL